MKMLEQEFRVDGAFEREANDEEKQALRWACNDNAESDDATPLPQSYSYRPLINTYAIQDSPDNKWHVAADESTLLDPLITSSDKEAILPVSVFPRNLSCSPREARASSIKEPISSDGQCSYTQSVLNVVNVLCGIGILSMPYALKQGGWLSILLLFLLGFISCYTGILIKRCLDSSAQLQTFPDIGHAAFGLIGRIFISAILYAELYFSCVEYLIMMSDNLSASFPNAQLDIAGIHLNSYQICAIVATLVILPTVWLRNLSLLSYVSVGGVVTLALVVLCLMWFGLASDVGFHPGGKALDFTNLPIAVGIFSFCYGSHSVFPNIYSSMKEPSRFPSVLVVSFILSGVLYAGVATLGFLMFGEATFSQYTLNLPQNMLVSKIAGWAMIIAPVTKFGLSMTPVALSLEDTLPGGRLKFPVTSILIRTALTVSTLIVALTVPYFGSVMALIGSLLVMLISVILPCACYMRIDKRKRTTCEIMICTAMLAIGAVCAILGTYSSVKSMLGN